MVRQMALKIKTLALWIDKIESISLDSCNCSLGSCNSSLWLLVRVVNHRL